MPGDQRVRERERERERESRWGGRGRLGEREESARKGILTKKANEIKYLGAAVRE
jgi:hypothetical protein